MQRCESWSRMYGTSAALSSRSTVIRTISEPARHFFFNDPATTEISTLSLHDALPISSPRTGITTLTPGQLASPEITVRRSPTASRSEEHTSELQSRSDIVCRLLLEKKKTQYVYFSFLQQKKKIKINNL